MAADPSRSVMELTGLTPARLALLCALLPLLAAFGSYFLSAELARVPWCWPMIDGCTSISRAARTEPAIFLFRFLMLPQAVLLLLCWTLVRAWLQASGASAAQTRVIWASGLIGALALALYTAFLGSSGEFYQFMRRFGITFHFAGTGLAQLLTMRLLRRQRSESTPALRWLWYLIVGQWALAMLHVVLKASLTEYDIWENRLEWWLALLMALWYLPLARQWREEQLALKLALRHE